MVLPPSPWLLDAAFQVNSRKRHKLEKGEESQAHTCLSWDWVWLRTLVVDTLLYSRGSAGSIPNFETRCSVLERSEK